MNKLATVIITVLVLIVLIIIIKHIQVEDVQYVEKIYYVSQRFFHKFYLLQQVKNNQHFIIKKLKC